MTSPHLPRPVVPVDRDRLMDAIHTLQVDLQLLADWLARDADPVMDEDALWSIQTASAFLKRRAPVQRH